METERWTVESRDRNGKLLAETHVLWDPATGITHSSTRRTASPEEWEALRAELRRRLEESPE